MTLLIKRDADGTVTITNPVTGQSTTRSTGIVGQPSQTIVEQQQSLPAHSWSHLA